MILTIRTDKPESEIGLINGREKLAYETWEAHRQLAETIHRKIQELLRRQSMQLDGITGIVVYEGPGSFTGLRIGMSVANTLAYGLGIPVAACGGENWVEQGVGSILSQPSLKPVVPEYGAAANITKPRK